jgi:hypothetical protein
MGASRFRAMAVALFLAALAALTLSGGAGAANSQKPYSVVICGNDQTVLVNVNGTPTPEPACTSNIPAVIAPGGTTTASVTLTNENKAGSGIQLGSENLSVPTALPGFAIAGATLPNQQPPNGQCPSSLNQQVAACFYLLDSNGNVVPAGSTGTTIGFRQLNLAAQTSITITITLVTPAPSATACTTASPCNWTDAAKQSNDFSGTGNLLNADLTASAYGTVTSATASCGKKGCSTTLGNGGNANSAPGSISTTVSTAKANSTVTQVEAIDFGTQLPSSNCSGVSSQHMTFENLSNIGSDRSQTITIQTTDFRDYQSEVCLATRVPFTELVIVTNPDGSKSESLQLTTQSTTLPDGTAGFEGLLPDCGSQALQVNCNKTPGVVANSRVTIPGTPPQTLTTHSIQAQIPPGFDMWVGN